METKTTHIRNSRYLIITFIYGLSYVVMVLPLCMNVYNSNNAPSSSAEDCQREKKSDSIFSFKKRVVQFIFVFLQQQNNPHAHRQTRAAENSKII